MFGFFSYKALVDCFVVAPTTSIAKAARSAGGSDQVVFRCGRFKYLDSVTRFVGLFNVSR